MLDNFDIHSTKLTAIKIPQMLQFSFKNKHFKDDHKNLLGHFNIHTVQNRLTAVMILRMLQFSFKNKNFNDRHANLPEISTWRI